MNLSPDAYLLIITPVEIFKIVTLRFYKADLFFIENFGHFIWKDTVIVPIGKEKESATFGEMVLMTAIKDLWAKTSLLRNYPTQQIGCAKP